MYEVDFYFGLGSRYSYLAFTQVTRIETKYQCLFEFHPISSVELMEMRGSSPFRGPPQSGQYDWSYRRTDAERWAEYYGVPFIEPKPPPTDHRLMAKACYAAGLQGALRPYCEALFRAIFVESHQIDAERCVVLCTQVNLDPKRFVADLASEMIDQRVTAAARHAFERGVFGVPTFFVRDRMFWGNDRLVLVEYYLAREAKP